MSGIVVAIFRTAAGGAPLEDVAAIEALAGAGLAGDRHSSALRGKPIKPDQQCTLIESEALAAAARDYGIELPASALRRNLLTRGVPLNHLVGREFRVGAEVVLRGVELCEPCGHLESLTVLGIRKALIHRGGLRAEILCGGTIRRGDAIVVD